MGLVDRSDLVRGYEYERGRYLIIEDSDLEAVQVETKHTINIEAFVDAAAIPPIWHDKPYYLAPDGRLAEETFVVLREAMRKTGQTAVGRLVLSSRERVVTLSPEGRGIFIQTMRNPTEVRASEPYFEDIPDVVPDPEMLDLAESLIARKSTEFNPADYEDRYETALLEMIRQRLKGQTPKIAKPREASNVVNLMDALRKSLSQAKPPARSRRKAGAEETAKRKTTGTDGGSRKRSAKSTK